MIDGTYQVRINTPFGRKTGTVALRVAGDTVLADIDAPIVGKRQARGRLEGDEFTAEGAFKLKLMGNISFSLRGKVIGDHLSVVIDSNKGTFELAGTRM